MKRAKILIAISLLLLAGYLANDMFIRQEQELLWGWRPFFLILACWFSILLLVADRFSPVPKNRKLLLLSCMSGVLLSAGFPISPLTPLMFVGFVPLLMINAEILEWKGGPARGQMFKYAFNAFLIWNVCTTWWVLNTSFLPGIVANVLNAIIMATVFTIFHQASAVLKGRLPMLAFVSMWIAFEYLHLFWDISWPWLNLGHAFAQYPSWVQWYEFTGVFGGSLWILLANYWTWKTYTGFQKNKVIDGKAWGAILAWILIPVLFGVIRWATYPLEEGDVQIAVIQPNFEPHYEKFTYSKRDQLTRFVELSESVISDQIDYLVFPETSFSSVLLNDIEKNGTIRRLRQVLAPYPNIHLVTGLESYRTHPGPTDLKSIRVQSGLRDTIYYDVQNSAIQITQGEQIHPYFKSKLVPGAEFFPFRDIFPFIKPLIRMLQGSVAGLTKQEEREVFHSAVATVAPVICYESIYGAYVGQYVRKGADIIFVITNDGWWDDTPGHLQHLKFATLRAIEHRRPVVRSANTGISCFINQRGDILQPTGYEVEAAITGFVDPGDGYTFYSQWGDIIARISVFLALLLLALTIVRGKLSKSETPD